MTVKFSSHKSIETLIYTSEPILNIIKIVFSTNETEWVSRLASVNILVKIDGFDKLNKLKFSSQEALLLPITPFHKQPSFEINRFFRPKSKGQIICDKWKVEMILHNLNFKKDEFLTVDLMDSDYVKKRVEDWSVRINNLLNQVADWVSNQSNITFRFSRKLPMHEGLMKDFNVPMKELDTADILKNGKLIIAIKPFGLWILGANGRIDLLSAKGNFVLIDEAEAFQNPKWKIFLSHDKKQGIQFNKNSFGKILSDWE